MPTPDDIDPVQDSKAAREAADGAAPDMIDLYLAWAEAERTADSAKHLLRAAENTEREAQKKLAEAEKDLGMALLDGVKPNSRGDRSGFFLLGKTVFRADAEWDGVREYRTVTIRPFPVTTVEIG